MHKHKGFQRRILKRIFTRLHFFGFFGSGHLNVRCQGQCECSLRSYKTLIYAFILSVQTFNFIHFNMPEHFKLEKGLTVLNHHPFWFFRSGSAGVSEQTHDLLWPLLIVIFGHSRDVQLPEERQQTFLCALVVVISPPLSLKSPAQIKHGWLDFWSSSGFLLHTSRQQQSHGWREICQASPLQCSVLLWD